MGARRFDGGRRSVGPQHRHEAFAVAVLCDLPDRHCPRRQAL
ncbi:hypothetical protein BURMUCF1_A1562 [Burkholderia multivorans ATCC BAA-247]|nr:hypothetical protein BURMUCF1_A1562 [Burkholderia multivorans ATCC BAA-247]